MGITKTREQSPRSLKESHPHIETLRRTVDGENQFLQVRIIASGDDQVPIEAIGPNEEKIPLKAEEMRDICIKTNTRIPSSLQRIAESNPDQAMPIPSNTPQGK